MIIGFASAFGGIVGWLSPDFSQIDGLAWARKPWPRPEVLARGSPLTDGCPEHFRNVDIDID
jgi:hypothetical protein